MHIQKIFVILAFNNQLLESAISLLVQIPGVGPKLEAPVRSLLGKGLYVPQYFLQPNSSFQRNRKRSSEEAVEAVRDQFLAQFLRNLYSRWWFTLWCPLSTV